MDLQTAFDNFYNSTLRFYDEGYMLKQKSEIYILLMVTVPLSLLLYVLFSRGKHKTLVDLGHGHTWLIK